MRATPSSLAQRAQSPSETAAKLPQSAAKYPAKSLILITLLQLCARGCAKSRKAAAKPKKLLVRKVAQSACAKSLPSGEGGFAAPALSVGVWGRKIIPHFPGLATGQLVREQRFIGRGDAITHQAFGRERPL